MSPFVFSFICHAICHSPPPPPPPPPPAVVCLFNSTSNFKCFPYSELWKIRNFYINQNWFRGCFKTSRVCIWFRSYLSKMPKEVLCFCFRRKMIHYINSHWIFERWNIDGEIEVEQVEYANFPLS